MEISIIKRFKVLRRGRVAKVNIWWELDDLGDKWEDVSLVFPERVG